MGAEKIVWQESSKASSMRLSRFAVDDGPHNSDGLLMHAWDGAQEVTAFVSRRVMDDWVDPRQPYGRRKSLFREQYNALGKRNLAGNRVVSSHSSTGWVRLSTASIRSSMCCCRTSRTAARCST
jgi:hypothetical protein